MAEASIDGMAPFTIVEMLERASVDAPLLILPDRTVRYGDIVERSKGIAAAMSAAGIAKGDRVALLLPNGVDWFLITTACARIGAAYLSLNARLGGKEIGDFIARARCTALIYDPLVRGGAVGAVIAGIAPEKLTSLRLIVTTGREERMLPTDAPVRMLDDLAGNAAGWVDTGGADDPFFMVPTSGTTSLPKLVVHIQSRVAHHAWDVARAFKLPPDGKILLAIPLCGGFGFSIAITCMAAGLPIVLLDAFDPAETAEIIVREGVTHMYGTNDMLAALLAARPEERPFPSLQVYGHANFTPGMDDLPPEAERRGVRMLGMFGLSETMAFLAAQPLDAPIARRAEGGGILVCPEARWRARDSETGGLAGIGETGELEVLTPDCMTGYFEDSERTAAAFTEDGYLRTGDIVRVIDDQIFDFVARGGDMLRIGGYLVSPAEIEDVIKGAGPIAACQVVAVTQAQKARPVAFVVANPGATIDEPALSAVCARDLAIYKRPVRIVTLDALPTVNGPNGAKVQKHVLRDMASELLGQPA